MGFVLFPQVASVGPEKKTPLMYKRHLVWTWENVLLPQITSDQPDKTTHAWTLNTSEHRFVLLLKAASDGPWTKNDKITQYSCSTIFKPFLLFFNKFYAELRFRAFGSLPIKPSPPPPPLPPREILINSGVRREGRSSAHIYEEWQCSCAPMRERGFTYVFLLWYKFCNFTSAV